MALKEGNKFITTWSGFELQSETGVSEKESSIILNKLKEQNYIVSKRIGLFKIWNIRSE